MINTSIFHCLWGPHTVVTFASSHNVISMAGFGIWAQRLLTLLQLTGLIKTTGHAPNVFSMQNPANILGIVIVLAP